MKKKSVLFIMFITLFIGLATINSNLVYAIDSNKNLVPNEDGRQLKNDEKKQPNRICIDNPKSGRDVTDTFAVRGWALGNNGVVTGYLNGNNIGSIKTSYPREDVYNAYSGYNQRKSGWVWRIDKKALNKGKNTLVFKCGDATSKIEINYIPPQPRICIDTPKNRQDVADTFAVRGWALGNNGVVTGYLNGNNIGSIKTSYPREDVYNAYSGYNQRKSGWVWRIDKSALKEGLNTLTFKCGGVSSTIKVKYHDPRLKCESFSIGKSGWGQDLIAYKIYRNPDAKYRILMTYELHGFEDSYYKDGQVLVDSARSVIEYYSKNVTDNVQLVVVPSVNPDGLAYGRSNYGKGRTQMSLGIDINRDFDFRFKHYSSARNKNGQVPFTSPEAKALKKLVQEGSFHTVLDFHGWENSTIGDNSVAKHFRNSFEINTAYNINSSCHGYFVAWAKKYSTNVSIIEFPERLAKSANSLADGVIDALNKYISTL